MNRNIKKNLARLNFTKNLIIDTTIELLNDHQRL